MTDFIQQIASLSWWLGVVVVGIAINLFSALIKPRLDALAGRLSKRIRDRNKKKKDAWEKDVSHLSEDDNYRVTYSNKVNLEHLESIFSMLIGMSLFLIGSSIGRMAPDIELKVLAERYQTLARLLLFLISSIYILGGLINHIKAQSMARKLSEASREAADEER